MPYHHLALATHDMRAVDLFYTHAMGFELVKVEMANTPTGGTAKHFFYDTGDGEMMAFWELRDEALPQDFATGLSVSVGLPEWVNHLAFRAQDLADVERRKQRWLSQGYSVVEIDHDWCYSVYTTDPDGTMVEFCTTVGRFDEADRELARRALTSDDLPNNPPKKVELHEAEGTPLHLRADA